MGGMICYLCWDNACQLKWMRPSFVGVFGAGEENYGDDLMCQRSEIRGRKSEYNQTGAKVMSDKRIVNGGWSILNPHLSALNYFLVLEYQLLE